MTILAHKNDDEYFKMCLFNQIYQDHPYHHHRIPVQLVLEEVHYQMA
jgi:hypothetical protein